MTNANNKHAILVESLRLLTAAYREQVEALPEFVCHADEIALTFDDAKKLIADTDTFAQLAQPVREKIDAIDHALAQMTHSDKRTWSLEALENASEWETLRALARETLALMGESAAKPNLWWIAYVKGGKAEEESDAD